MEPATYVSALTRNQNHDLSVGIQDMLQLTEQPEDHSVMTFSQEG